MSAPHLSLNHMSRVERPARKAEPASVRAGKSIGMIFEIRFEEGVYERLDDMALAHGQPHFDQFVHDLAIKALEEWEAARAGPSAAVAD